VELLPLGGLGNGIPVRATVTAFGPTLSKVLGLNDVQESSLGLVFHGGAQVERRTREGVARPDGVELAAGGRSLAHVRHSGPPGGLAPAYTDRVIFKAVGEGRPYPDHGLETPRDWSDVAPRMVRLDELVTTKRVLDLQLLLAEDSTFYGDLFAHVVQWKDTLYLEDGLHRALRAALHQRPALHARVLVLD
jgi:Arc/MetJ family transcription regulator